MAFSYSGLKTAFYRLTNAQRSELSSQEVNDLAASFQETAFKHLLRETKNSIAFYTSPHPSPIIGEGVRGRGIHDLLVGGGVAANTKLREEIKRLSDEVGMGVYFPAKGMYGDNAAMIGIAAGFRAERGEFTDPDTIDRRPRWRVDEN